MKSTEYFSSWSESDTEKTPVYQQDLNRFASRFISGNVLDIGCGGKVYYQVDNATSWTGMDCASKRLHNVSFLHGRPEDVRVLTADARQLPFASRTFDTVCCFFLLHHLGRNNRKESARQVKLALAETRRILSDGGRLVVAENASGWLNWPYNALFPLSFKIFSGIWDVLLPFFWTQKELKQLAWDTGFQTCELVEIKQREWIYQPVLGFQLPPFLDNKPFSMMTLYVFR